ncbi:MAG TPA: TonB-dependent receptor [Gammaproteobacteria bacterium]
MNNDVAAPRSEVRIKPLTAAVAVAVGALCGAASARAQVADPLEEIVVTASRRETTVQDLPFNITALSGETLERRRLNDLAELGRWVPGLTVVDQGGRASNLMVVRGLNVASLNASEFLENSSGDSVQTYVGDIPLYLDLKLHDIERVEVLIGPQGTLYGAGTLGGAVRYIPRAPELDSFTLDLEGDVFGISHGEDTGFEGAFTVNVPIVDDRLALRTSLAWLDEPGYIDYPYLVREPGVSNPQPNFDDPLDVAANLRGERDVNWEETLSGRVALLFAPSDRVQATFNYYFQDQEAGGRSVNHRHSFGTGPYESAHRFVEPNDQRNRLFSIEVVADLGFAELTSATGFSDYDQLGQRDQTDFLLDQQWGYEEFPLFAAYTREASTDERTNQEIRLVSVGDGPWSWIGGVFYNDYARDAISEEFTPGYPEFRFGTSFPTGDLEYRQLTSIRLEEQAVFGEVTYRFADRWAATLGGRFFDYETEQSISADMPFWGDFGTPQVNRARDDGFLGKLNLAYDVGDTSLAYLTISEGYRIGGVNGLPECEDPEQSDVQEACLLPDEVLIKPDRTKNYEIGVHSTLADGRVNVNASVYYIDWKDIQTMARTKNGANMIFVNGGTARSRGLELSADARTNGPWSFSATYAYTDAELTSDAPLLVDREEDAFAGDRLAGTPEHHGSFYANYYRMLPGGLRLDIDYGLTFTSSVLTKVGQRNGGEVLGGYTLHNMSVGIGKERWSATLYADNLFDKFAETAVRESPLHIREVNGVAVRRYFRGVLRPRTFGIELRYSLGD